MKWIHTVSIFSASVLSSKSSNQHANNFASRDKEPFTHKISLSQQSLLHSFLKRSIYIFSLIYMWQEEHSRTKNPPAQHFGKQGKKKKEEH